MTTDQAHKQERISRMISWGHWFTLFNILLILPLASSYLFVSDWPKTLVGRIYALISLFGHFSFLSFVIYLLLLFPLTFLIRSHFILRTLSAIIATACITLLILDIVIFNHFKLHLNYTVWQLLINPEEGKLSRDWQFLFIFIPLIFLIELLFSTWCWLKLRSLSKRSHRVKPLIALFIASFIGSHLLYMWSDANFYRPVTMQQSKLPLSYPMTARSFLEKHGFLDRKSYEERLLQQGRLTSVAFEYPLGKLMFNEQNVSKKYNLLMIVIDGIHYDTYQTDMPKLMQFAQRKLQFSQHFSTGNYKDTGLVGLFYGISPTYLDNILSWRKSSVLISSLNEKNYKFSLHSTEGFNVPLYRQALFADYLLPPRANKTNPQTTQQWQQWLHNEIQSQELDKPASPWFGYIEYTPYSVTTRNKNSVPDMKFTKLYQQDIKEIDRQINAVLEDLQQKQLLDKTIVVITASHGITLSGQSLQNRRTTSSDYHRTILKVPLIVAWPDKAAAQIDKMSNHEDIMTTLMQQLLVVKNLESDYSQGENLFAPNRKQEWVIAGDAQQLVITTPTQTILLKNDGDYQVYDEAFQLEKDKKPNLSLLLNVLSSVRRFIAD